ncbi:MAG: hypothetical protein WA488_04960, partial [Mycobacterium sp.]
HGRLPPLADSRALDVILLISINGPTWIRTYGLLVDDVGSNSGGLYCSWQTGQRRRQRRTKKKLRERATLIRF